VQARGEALEREAADEFMAQGDRRLEAASRAYLASMLMESGDLDGAEREGQLAVSLSRGTPPVHAECLASLSRVLRARADVDGALARAEEAMAILDGLGALDEGESLVCLAWLEALHAAGRTAEAKASAAQARDRLQASAAKIADEGWRRSFLEQVRDNRRLLELAKELAG
jgi:hypothetical protein